MSLIVFFITAFLLSFPPAGASPVDCEAHGKYLVVTQPYREESGRKIEVFANHEGKLKCGGKYGRPHFVWDRRENSNNDQFSALKGKYLMISEGTDVDSGGAIIIDLETKEQTTTVGVPDVQLSEDSLLVSHKIRETSLGRGQADQCVTLTQRKLDEWRAKEKIAVKIKLKNCQCRKWIGETGNSVAQVRYKIDLNDLKETYLDEAGCAFFQ